MRLDNMADSMGFALFSGSPANVRTLAANRRPKPQYQNPLNVTLPQMQLYQRIRGLDR
jgi:hypothetical protein